MNKEVCQHRIDDRDSYIEGYVYQCVCGESFEVHDLINRIEELTIRLEESKIRTANIPGKADEQLIERMARCQDYGKRVKTGGSNSNCCKKCDESIKNGDGLCHCEVPSSVKLWFFRSFPEKDFDRFYCSCQGAD